MCLAPITLSIKSGHVQACRLVHGLYMANLTKCFDIECARNRVLCAISVQSYKLRVAVQHKEDDDFIIPC